MNTIESYLTQHEHDALMHALWDFVLTRHARELESVVPIIEDVRRREDADLRAMRARCTEVDEEYVRKIWGKGQ